jgi:hypothetical protein
MDVDRLHAGGMPGRDESDRDPEPSELAWRAGVPGMEMERAAEFPGGLLSQQAGQGLDHDLLDTGGSDFPVQGTKRRPGIGGDRVLSVPAVDGDIDSETPVP